MSIDDKIKEVEQKMTWLSNVINEAEHQLDQWDSQLEDLEIKANILAGNLEDKKSLWEILEQEHIDLQIKKKLASEKTYKVGDVLYNSARERAVITRFGLATTAVIFVNPDQNWTWNGATETAVKNVCSITRQELDKAGFKYWDTEE